MLGHRLFPAWGEFPLINAGAIAALGALTVMLTVVLAGCWPAA